MLASEGLGCDNMGKRRAGSEGAKVPHDGPMVATFWKHGQAIHFACEDVAVAINPFYAEIIISCQGDPQSHMFVISDDPDIEANMTTNGQSHAYDGFLLRDHNGQTIERITITDCRSVH